MADWFDLEIVGKKEEANGLTHLELRVERTPLSGTHRLPGQFVKLSPDGRAESLFAIASAPGPERRTFEFLIKHGSAVADAVSARRVGQTIKTTAVMGKGFPLEKAEGKGVLLFATGSGISPVRSLIGALRQHRARYRQICLYFGARTPDAFAYEDELTQWEKDGIDVTRTVSQPGRSGWQGLKGYVQAHVPPGPLENDVAFVCGQKEMVKGVTEALERAGLPRAQIFLNF